MQGAREAKASDATSAASMSPNQSPLRIDDNLLDELTSRLAALLNSSDQVALDVDAKDIRVNSVPELLFYVKSNEEIWECRHNPITGSLSTRAQNTSNSSSEFSWRRYLLRLHTAHTYPTEGGARWYWAVVVDIMAFVMVFWGASGVVMWWQIKSTRRFGSIAMLTSLVVAACLFYAMFQQLHS